MVRLNQQIAFSDEVLAQEGARSPTLQFLSTAPGVGPVVSAAFVATLDEAQRFNGAHHGGGRGRERPGALRGDVAVRDVGGRWRGANPRRGGGGHKA